MRATLLLADDSVTIHRVIELALANEDVRVVTVTDGQAAVQRIDADPPDIVLADVGMPKIDGYGVALQVKKTRDIPVLLLTGAFDPIDEEKARASGCDGILVKPFEPQQLVARVRELLAGQHTDALWPANVPKVDAASRAAASVAAPAPHPRWRMDPEPPRTPPPAAAFSNPAPPPAPPAPGRDAPYELPRPGWLRGNDAAATRVDVRPVPPADMRMAPPAAAPPREVAFSPPEPQRVARPAAPVPPPAAAPPQEPPAAEPSTVMRNRASMASAFSALLAAEQERQAQVPRLAAEPMSEAAVEEIVRRVLHQMTEEAVQRIVLETAERLIKEEIEKIRTNPV